MVRNRTFGSDWDGIHQWILLEGGNSVAKISIDHQTGPSTALNHSMRIDVTQADPHDRAGAINEGYWGMAVRPNTTYKGSFYAKADSAAIGPVVVNLVANQSGKALASAEITGVGAQWSSFISCSRPAK